MNSFKTQNLGLGIEPTDICDVTLARLASRCWARQMCPPHFVTFLRRCIGLLNYRQPNSTGCRCISVWSQIFTGCSQGGEVTLGNMLCTFKFNVLIAYSGYKFNVMLTYNPCGGETSCWCALQSELWDLGFGAFLSLGIFRRGFVFLKSIDIASHTSLSLALFQSLCFEKCSWVKNSFFNVICL